MTTWHGVFPAVTTKLRKDGSLDLEATRSSVARLIEHGASGVVMLPMLGENAYLTPSERSDVLAAARDAAAGRIPVLSGLAELTTDAAISAASFYRKAGVEGLMVFPSLAYKSDPRETEAWYRAVGTATDLPIMIYNNPLAYGVDVTPPILDALADVETIVCVKEESGDIRRVTDVFNACGDRYSVFCGVDDLLLESVALGASGWVSGMANAWPAECAKLFALCAAGRFEQARPLYRAMTEAFHLDTKIKLVQYVKLAENATYGAPEWTRPPRLPLDGEERENALAIIRRTVENLRGIANAESRQ